MDDAMVKCGDGYWSKRYSKWFDNSVFVPVFVAKKTRDGGLQKMLLVAAGKVFNYANKIGKSYDVPQMLFTSTGAIADAMQYPLFDQVENGVENTMNYLGFLGGTNALRGIPVVLDGYDILKKYNPTLRNYIQKWQRKTKFDNKKE